LPRGEAIEILPEEISEEEFGRLDQAAAKVKDGPSILRAWYERDDNAIPAVYILRSRKQRSGDGKDYTHDAAWKPVQSVLWQIINRAYPLFPEVHVRTIH